MLEAKWEIDKEEGKGWEYKAQGPSLFFESRINPLEEKFREFLKEPRTNGELYEFTLHSGFLTMHAVEVLTNWQNNGLLNVTLGNGDRARKGAFYISYDNYKSEPSKVSIKRK